MNEPVKDADTDGFEANFVHIYVYFHLGNGEVPLALVLAAAGTH